MKNLRMQQEMTDRGRLEIRVNTRIQARPVSGARVTVSYTGDPQNVIEELITDGDGRTETLDLGDAAARVQSGTECESAVFRIYGESGGGRV